MQSVNECYLKVKKDCFRYIASQETSTDKFKNKDKMIKSFLVPASFWIANKVNKKKNNNYWISGRTRHWKNYHLINYKNDFRKIF